MPSGRWLVVVPVAVAVVVLALALPVVASDRGAACFPTCVESDGRERQGPVLPGSDERQPRPVARLKPILIGEAVWHDFDRDGRRAPGEPGVAGVEMELVDAAGAVVDRVITRAEGYHFEADPGRYTVRVARSSFAPGGALAGAVGGAAAADVELTYGISRVLGFGFSTAGASLAGAVFQDVDLDGDVDPAEGLAGVVVRLTGDTDGDGTDDVDATGLTAAGGHYAFTGLAAGDYRLHVRWEGFAAGAPLQNLTQVADPDALLDDGTAFSLATDQHLAARDFGYLRRPQPGVEKDSSWRLEPTSWPLEQIVVGGLTYSRQQAHQLMYPPGGGGDQSLVLFSEVVAAKLNMALGNDAACIAATVAAADAWLAAHPPGSGVSASSGAWRNLGKPLHKWLQDYDHGKLCAPAAGAGATANHLPVAEDLDLIASEGTALAIELVASDADLDPLTWTIVAAPAHGTLSGAAPSLTYTPDAGFFGSDLFVARADDGVDGSNAAWATIFVELVNDAPQAQDDAYSLDEGATLVVAAPGVLGNDVDPDGDALSAALLSGPAHGTLSLVADGSFTYAHDGGETTADSFSYEVCDDGTPQRCDTEGVDLTIQPVNDLPVVVGESYRTAGNTELAAGGAVATGAAAVATPLSLLANDVDADGPDPLSVVPGTFATVAGGTVSLAAAGGFTYLPAAGFSGSDSFDYQVSDGADVVSASAVVEVAAMVWYVENDAAAGGHGRSTAPFDTLAAAAAAAAAGETVFVFTGDGTTAGQADGFTLDAGQQLIGQGVDLVVDFGAGPTTLVVAGTPPAITAPSAGVSASATGGVAVRGLRIVAPGGDGIALDGVSGLTVEEVTIEAPGGNGIDATGLSDLRVLGGAVSGGVYGMRLSGLSGANEISAATFTGAGSDLLRAEMSGGSLTIDGSSWSDAANDAIFVAGTDAGNLALTISGNQFLDIAGESLQVTGATGFSGQLDLTFSDNTVEVTAAGFGGSVAVSGQELGHYVLDVVDNRFGPAAPSVAAGAEGPGLIVIDANDQAAVRGTIARNTIRNAGGSSGLVLFVDEDAKLTVVAEDNAIENVGSDGIQVANFCFGACAADLDLVLAGNTVDGHSLGPGAFVGGVALFGSGGTGPGSGTCVAFDGNAVTDTAGGFFDFYLDDFGASNPLFVEGAGNAAVTAADIQALNGQPAAVVGLFGNIVFSGGVPCDRP